MKWVEPAKVCAQIACYVMALTLGYVSFMLAASLPRVCQPNVPCIPVYVPVLLVAAVLGAFGDSIRQAR